MSKRPSSSPVSSSDQLELLRPGLLALALRLTRSRSDAEDLVQTAMLRSLEHFAAMPEETDWPRWTSTVVRRLAIDRWRRQRRWPETPHDDALEVRALRPPSDPGASATPSLLEIALETVSASARDICRLHYFHGLSYERIARLLGIPLRTVGTRLHRARLHVRKRLAQLVKHRDSRVLTPSRPALPPPPPVIAGR
jgi:RNA polymerase sigma-70 factor (ECF subfamily)